MKKEKHILTQYADVVNEVKTTLVNAMFYKYIYFLGVKLGTAKCAGLNFLISVIYLI